MDILLVDDDKVTLNLLEKSLAKWGHAVLRAENGAAAWQAIQQHRFDMVISDWLMPELDGIELCRRIRSADLGHYLYLILISSQDTRADIVNGLQAGVDDYLTKPLNLEELRARVEIGQRVIDLERKLTRRYQELARNYYQTIHMFTQLLESYDDQLGGHCRRVGRLVLELAKLHPGVSADQYATAEAAGLVHDVGMVGLPVDMVGKSVLELNAEEKELYRTHPIRGELILGQVDMLKPVARIVRLHHEHADGRGFPDGIGGDELPVLAQLVGAASYYDNLRHKRAIADDALADYIQRAKGYRYAADIGDLLMEIHRRQVVKAAQAQEIWMPVDALEPGMRLSRNLSLKTGAFLLAADTVLDAPTIERLAQYRQLKVIDKTVAIAKDSVRSE